MPLITGNRAVERAYIGATQLNAIMHAGVNLLDGTVLPRKGRTFLMSKSSLILDEGTGGPTWSRATKAWGFNELGYLRELASGCAFFGGARLVRNLCTSNSDNFSAAALGRCSIVSAAVANYRGTNTAVKYLLDNTAGSHYARIASSAYAGMRICVSVVVKRNEYQYISVRSGQDTTPEAFNLTTNTWINAAQAETVARSFEVIDATWIRLTTAATISTGTKYFGVGCSSSLGSDNWTPAGTENFTIADVSICDVTGYDASYIPEYVSVGVSLNTVRTTSEDFSNAAWTKTACTVTGTNTIVCANATSNQYIGQTGGGTSIVAGTRMAYSYRVKRVVGGVNFLQILPASTTFGPSQFVNVSLLDGTYSATGCTAKVTAISADTFDVTIYPTVTITGSDICNVVMINAITDARLPSFTGDGIKSFQLLRVWSVEVSQFDASYVPPYYAVGVGTNVYFGAGIDGAKYFETGWQGAPIAAANLLKLRREASAINNLLHSRDLSNAAWSTKTNITAAKTATGLDGIVNTATTLTAAAADAIILQPTSGIASAARCASAYVKRRTGTGTISFTQDGGSTWTDITSQINGSTWSRVQITSTLADPSVGFKISTSGDAIDVDVVQNEAGAKATSPIVTTTAAITRNADSLTYQTAGNIDFAVGTVFAKVLSNIAASTRGVVYVGSSYFGTTSGLATTSFKINDGTTNLSKSGISAIDSAPRKRVGSWGPAGLSVTGDGLTPSVGAFDGAFGNGVSITIGENLNGYIGPVAIYNYQMTDAEQQAITT